MTLAEKERLQDYGHPHALGQDQQPWTHCDDVLGRLEEQRRAVEKSLQDWLERFERAQREQWSRKQQLLADSSLNHGLSPSSAIGPPTAGLADAVSSGNGQAVALRKAALVTKPWTPEWGKGQADQKTGVDAPVVRDQPGLARDEPGARPVDTAACRAAWEKSLEDDNDDANEQDPGSPGRDSDGTLKSRASRSLSVAYEDEETRLEELWKLFLKELQRFGIEGKSEEELQGRWIWQVTHTPWFHVLCSAMILANAMFIGVEAQMNLQAELEGSDVGPEMANIDFAFCIWFLFELVVRLWAEQNTFFHEPDLKLNVVDIVVVVMSVIGTLINPSGAASKASGARVLRLFRFVRIFRLVRVIKSFQSLRLLAFSIIESMGALLWCALIVFVAIYLFAVLFMDGATDYFRNHPDEREGELVRDLKAKYGSVMKAMICLFMTISGGIDWYDAIQPLRALHWLYEPIFIFYAFVMLFGVLNVVVATFVENTAQVSRKDKEAKVYTEICRVKEYAEDIKQFFHAADTDKSGRLSWAEFEAHLDDNRVKAYFQSLELDVSEAHTLFELLDVDGDGGVEIDEFVGGCMRLKGTARSLDVNVLARRVEKLLARVQTFMDADGNPRR